MSKPIESEKIYTVCVSCQCVVGVGEMCNYGCPYDGIEPAYRPLTKQTYKVVYTLIREEYLDIRDAEIMALSQLQKNWNTFDSDPPTESTCRKAVRLRRVLDYAGAIVTRVSASSMGGVALGLEAGARKALVEVYNGEVDNVVAGIYGDNTEIYSWHVDTSQLAETIQKIYTHLKDKNVKN